MQFIPIKFKCYIWTGRWTFDKLVLLQSIALYVNSIKLEILLLYYKLFLFILIATILKIISFLI